MEVNSKIISVLSYLKLYREMQNKDHPANAIGRVIDSLEKCQIVIQSGKQAKEILNGVGEKISLYIDSIIKNNKNGKCGIKELDNLSENDKNKLLVIYQMIKFEGIGIKTAMKYYDQGITDIEEFKKVIENEGTNRQKIGFKNSSNGKVSRDLITPYLYKFNEYLNLYNQNNGTSINLDVGGSYLREKQTCGDIDILLWSLVPDQMNDHSINLIAYFNNNNLLNDTISEGQKIYQGYAFLNEEYPHFRIDIKFLKSMNQYYFAILYFTGSAKFNRKMRLKAKEFGLKLGNDYLKIRSNNKNIYVRNELDIFNILQIKYLEPKDR